MKNVVVLLLILSFCAPLSAVTLENQYIKITVNDFNQRIDYFGITGGNPGLASDDNSPLLHEKDPSMNSVSLYLDGKLYKIGVAGKAVQKPEISGSNLIVSKWQIEKILFVQNIEIVNGATSLLPDTIRITYAIHNQDTVSHEIGVKLSFDTFNGPNDNVPFLVPLIGIVANERKVTNIGAAFKIPEFFVSQDSVAAPQTVFMATLRDKDLASPDDVVFASPDTLDSTGWKPAIVKKPMKNPGGLPDTGYCLFWGPIRFPDSSDKKSIKRLSTEIGAYTPSISKSEMLDVSLGAPKLARMRSFTIVALINNKDKFKTVRNVDVKLSLPEGCRLLTTKLPLNYTIPEMQPDAIKFLYYVVDCQDMPAGESNLTLTVKGEVTGSVTVSSTKRSIRK